MRSNCGVSATGGAASAEAEVEQPTKVLSERGSSELRRSEFRRGGAPKKIGKMPKSVDHLGIKNENDIGTKAAGKSGGGGAN